MIIDRSSIWEDEPAVAEEKHSPQIILGDDWPSFLRDAVEARLRLEELSRDGREPVASVLILQEKSFERAINLHEKAQLLLNSGCEVGPYFIGEQLVPGLRFYQPLGETDNE